MTNPESPRDPLNLDAVDRAIRINELEARAAELGMISNGVDASCPPEVHEQFLRNVIDYENAPLVTQADMLRKAGTPFPPPGELDDAALTAALWRVIRTLAARNTFLHHTNHLSDRALYEHLWTDSLREENPDMPPGSGWSYHIDLIGSGSDEHIEIGLRYYDSEESRQRWARDFPNMVIPPHEDPPFDRNRLLPQPPEPTMMECDEADEEGDGDDTE